MQTQPEKSLAEKIVDELREIGVTLMMHNVDPRNLPEEILVQNFDESDAIRSLHGYHVRPKSDNAVLFVRYDPVGDVPVATTEVQLNILLSGGKSYRIHYRSPTVEKLLRIWEETAPKIEDAYRQGKP
jgi:hypothetical protein